MDEEAVRDALRRAVGSGEPRLEVLAGHSGETPRQLGLVSGSFDPLTVAHAALAGALRDQGADAVLFVYSPRTMPKEGPAASEPPLLPPVRRLAAVAAYCRGRPGLGVAVCSHGLYADQAAAAAGLLPRARIVVGVGSDKVRQLFDPAWYEDPDAALERLFGVASVAYAVRAGEEQAVERALERAGRWRGRVRRLDLPPEVAEVSSSAVRASVRRGEDAAPLVPPEVLDFVREAP